MGDAPRFHGLRAVLVTIFMVECSTLSHVSDWLRGLGSSTPPWRLTDIHLLISEESGDFQGPSASQRYGTLLQMAICQSPERGGTSGALFIGKAHHALPQKFSSPSPLPLPYASGCQGFSPLFSAPFPHSSLSSCCSFYSFFTGTRLFHGGLT